MSDSAGESVPEAPQSTSAGTTPAAATKGIDIDALADKVYRLMLADLRREQSRRGGSRSDSPDRQRGVRF